MWEVFVPVLNNTSQLADSVNYSVGRLFFRLGAETVAIKRDFGFQNLRGIETFVKSLSKIAYMKLLSDVVQ